MANTPMTRNDNDGMIRTDRLSTIIDRLRSHAETDDYVPKPRTLVVTAWDDGDVSAYIEHNGETIFNPAGIYPHQEKYHLRYNPADDQIVFKHFIKKGDDQEDGGRTGEDTYEHVIVEESVLGEEVDVNTTDENFG